MKTAFILGAGASIPYGFPSGLDLIERILAYDHNMPPQLPRFGVEEEHAKTFLTELKNSHSSSIDAFLEIRREFLEVGKLAIALRLIEKEDYDYLRLPINRQDWYNAVLNAIRTPAFEDLILDEYAFITFNYDRSLEEFLFTSLRSSYGKNVNEVAKVLKRIPIIHVHGQLGYLPWQDAAHDDIREYSPDISEEHVDKAVRGIKIISEDVEANFEKARVLMHDAEQIILLGFGYHKLNMERLRIPFSTEGNKTPKVLGTFHKMTHRKQQEIKRGYPKLELREATCRDFLDNDTLFNF